MVIGVPQAVLALLHVGGGRVVEVIELASVARPVVFGLPLGAVEQLVG